MSSVAAASHALDDELVRATRARNEERLAWRARLAFSLSGVAVAAGATASALLLHAGPPLSLWRLALFISLYALVSRVEFEIGGGYAIPTQLVLVPMLFALPPRVVPLAVACGLVLRTVADRPWPLRDPGRALPLVASAAHALGPALVLALAGGYPLRWHAWPVYAAALAAQFGFDFAASLVGSLGQRIRPRALLGFLAYAWSVDLALAPLGLVIASTATRRPALVLLVLPLVGLLRTFAGERQRRIDHALELSDAYRGTAFLLGDVVEADDAYTGSHSRHVVDLVLAVADELGLPDAERRDAEFVALLHDVGKIRIPAAIINKPGPLDAQERAVIETHTIEGEQMLARVGGLLGHVGALVRSVR